MSTFDYVDRLVRSDTCMAFALWRMERGFVGSVIDWLFGVSPPKPEGYEQWKRAAWRGVWP